MTNKKPNYATKDDVREIVTDIVQQATDAIVTGMQKMFDNVPTKEEFKKLENKVDTLTVEVHYIKDEIKNINADISTMPRYKAIS
ncbi:MAG TPA: DUF2730 family protein [Patescibacteria group bacterium]|nr:DUF2730 family protein [Patescibacteria group bacterium]